MFIVTKDGKKRKVDDSDINYENDYVPFSQSVACFADDVCLKKVWSLDLYKSGDRLIDPDCEVIEGSEKIAELIYDHEPSEEEILWAMCRNGLTIYDIAYVSQGYMYGWK